MSKLETEKYRAFSDWFLKLFAIEVLVLGQENWESLPADSKNPEVMPVLGGLTHKDYVDGPVLWSAITDEEIMLQLVVMREGFSGGLNQVRNLVLDKIAPGLQLSRHEPGAEQIKNIQTQGKKESAVGLFLSGNRNLTSPLKGGLTTLMREPDKLYPFINLADRSPVFPSGSTLGQNAGELINRVLIKRQQAHEFLYLMKPLTKANLDELAESKKSKAGRLEILAKLEIIRAYGVLKTFIEVAKLGLVGANPLLQNTDNLPLLKQSQKLLQEDVARTEWLLEKGYFAGDDLKLMLTFIFADHEKS